ncbi:oligosaccharide flippase family protein [Fusicatenibacter sp.]
MPKHTRKNTLLLGTLILTASGIICRILGFLYRIFLSRLIGAEAFGIYQLATPLYALMLSLGAGGMQTVLSRFVASYLAQKDSRRAKIYLAAGCGIVMLLSLFASVFLFFGADFIGTRLLFEPRTVLLLQILSLGILPSGIHNCLSAWYLGQNQTALPSFCQLLEQFVRMGASFLAWHFCLSRHLSFASVAAVGTAAGELFSCLFLTACLFLAHIRSSQKHRPISVFFEEKTLWYDAFRELTALNLPLTLNRILLNVLHSIESALLPGHLIASGLSRKAALSQYGVLTGMALPMIFFPSAVTHAVSVMLLPGVARQQASGTPEQILDTIRYTISFCILLGTSAVFTFFFFGPYLGRFLFQNEEVGVFLRILSFLSPFLYLETTLGSILNGLGKTSLVFFQNLAGDVIRILAILFLVPILGIRGYLYGILASELTIMTIALFFLRQESAKGFAVH